MRVNVHSVETQIEIEWIKKNIKKKKINKVLKLKFKNKMVKINVRRISGIVPGAILKHNSSLSYWSFFHFFLFLKFIPKNIAMWERCGVV